MAAAGPWRNDLRFEGGRFAGRGLPISVLRELQVYCDLVVKVAKAVFLRDNPYHRRAPNGFERRFLPRLVYIDKGSVTPVLEREFSNGLAIDDEFDFAARHIGDVVAAVHEETVMLRLMRLPGFDIGEISKLGKTLEPSEKIILRDSSNREAILDEEVRQYLEHYSRQTYIIRGRANRRQPMHKEPAIPRQLDVEAHLFARVLRTRLVGRVTGVDAARGRFTIWSDASRRYCRGPFRDSSDLPLLKRVITDDRRAGPSVELDGFVRFDSFDIPRGWSELHSLEEKLSEQSSPFEKLEIQLRNLSRLQERWFDDASRAPTSNAIQTATAITDLLRSRSLPTPTAFPTPDGGVSLEWILSDVQIGVTILAPGNEGDLSFWNENTGADGFEQNQKLDAERVVRYVSRLTQD